MGNTKKKSVDVRQTFFSFDIYNLFDSVYIDAVVCTAWFMLPCLWVLRLFGLGWFLIVLFFSFFCLTFALSFVMRNPAYRQGDLFGSLGNVFNR